MSEWLILVLVGLLSIIAGAIALLFPLPASLTLNAFVGASLAIGGALGLFGALRSATGRDRLWGALLGVAVLLLGLSLLAQPLAGIQTLTLIFAIGFLASGLFKLLLGLQLGQHVWKAGLILSGAISVILAVMILTGLPQSAALVPGLLLAVELLSYGWGILFLGLAWKRQQGL